MENFQCHRLLYILALKINKLLLLLLLLLLFIITALHIHSVESPHIRYRDMTTD